ncbi:hypothetical protein [uncultured Tenacibaculum sp.]|uniref:hypothetical protein n=1 Tax=uncultured Tenacibaculum sp. TaxID=174713 RepID=UPI0026250D11|nr:hypothetical protein [uncultured Tenacibaculum sp.]
MSYKELVFDSNIVSDSKFIEFLKFHQNQYSSKVLLLNQTTTDRVEVDNENLDKKGLRNIFTKEKIKSMLIKFVTTEYYESDI